jgi:hypothetical protein
MPRIAVVYQGVFQYDALNAFAEALAEGFDALGLQTVLLDTKNDEAGSRAKLGELLTRPERIAFILGPGGILADAEVGGQNLYGRFNVPFVAFLVDHPSYMLMRLAKARNALITCIDRAHVRFLREIGLANAAYVPHGASLPEALIPWAERTGGIAFAASANDDAALRTHVLETLPAGQAPILGDIADDPAIGTLDAAEAAVRAHPAAAGFGWTQGYNASLILFLNEVDRVLRSVRRNAIVRALDAVGVAVDLYGRGWDRFPFRHHRVHPALPFAEMCEELQGYRLALHLNPLFSEGLHERICAAAMAGCAVVTDGNPEIAAVYPDGAAAIHFSTAEPLWSEALAARLAATDAAPIAQSGRRITARSHSWGHRAAEIVALVDAAWPDRVRG